MSDLRGLYSIDVLNPAGDTVGQVTKWTSLNVTQRFNGVGSWIVSAPSAVLAPLLTPGGGARIRRGEDTIIVGPYVLPTKNLSAETPNGELVLTGSSYEQHLADRIAYPDPAHEMGSWTAADDAQTGVAETVILHYVNVNAGPGAIAARRVSGLTLGVDHTHGSTIKGQARGDNLLDVITGLAKTDDLGFRIVEDGSGGLVFSVYVPQDLSGQVRFAWGLGNAQSISYSAPAPQSTHVGVWGSGTGTSRVMRLVSNSTASTTWGRRIEKVVDRSDTADTTLLDQTGNEQLATDNPGLQLSVVPLDTQLLRFGRDWGLGDKVTAAVDGIEYSDVIREVGIVVDGNGEQITPVIGTPGATTAPWPYRNLKDLIRAFQLSQRRT